MKGFSGEEEGREVRVRVRLCFSYLQGNYLRGAIYRGDYLQGGLFTGGTIYRGGTIYGISRYLYLIQIEHQRKWVRDC